MHTVGVIINHIAYKRVHCLLNEQTSCGTYIIMTSKIIMVGWKRKLKWKIGHNHNYRPATRTMMCIASSQ